MANRPVATSTLRGSGRVSRFLMVSHRVGGSKSNNSPASELGLFARSADPESHAAEALAVFFPRGRSCSSPCRAASAVGNRSSGDFASSFSTIAASFSGTSFSGGTGSWTCL
jgi:hypothetical protein